MKLRPFCLEGFESKDAVLMAVVTKDAASSLSICRAEGGKVSLMIESILEAQNGTICPCSRERETEKTSVGCRSDQWDETAKNNAKAISLRPLCQDWREQAVPDNSWFAFLSQSFPTVPT